MVSRLPKIVTRLYYTIIIDNKTSVSWLLTNSAPSYRRLPDFLMDANGSVLRGRQDGPSIGRENGAIHVVGMATQRA
jgi:hypothetical protein